MEPHILWPAPFYKIFICTKQKQKNIETIFSYILSYKSTPKSTGFEHENERDECRP